MYGEFKKLEEASDGPGESEAVTLDGILIAGQRHGLSFSDMKQMELGQVLDYCIESMNRQTRAEKRKDKPTRRKATQADIDAYFGGRHGR